jgi:GTPase Era involved in 16S rRNA processing
LLWKKSVDNSNTFFKDSKIPCILVESKVDLLPVDEQDKIDELKQFSDENGFNGCFRTSAKTGKNVSESMEFLVKEIIKKLEEYHSKERDSTKDRNSVKLDPDKHNEEVKKRKNIFGGCCKWEL